LDWIPEYADDKQSYQWNWSDNWEKEQEEQKHMVMLLDFMAMKKYDIAQEHLNWLLKENPKLNPLLYKSGFIIYEHLIDDCDDPRIKSQLINEEKKLKELMKKNFPFIENGS
jgi:hypothetical protein